jgi:hypothetical protein
MFPKFSTKFLTENLVSYGEVVLHGDKDICVYGGRRSLGGEIGKKEEEFFRAGSAWCSKSWVVGFQRWRSCCGFQGRTLLGISGRGQKFSLLGEVVT